jgi:hypothetical protein
MNIQERLDLQHGADATVARALVAALEQPAINLLALVLAGGNGLGEGGLGVVQQVTEQPQVQGVDLGDIALVR